ncbi:MAG TPA: SLBB domain-containing protein [Stenomitos sp.]
MKRIVAFTLALGALAMPTPARAENFVLSGREAPPSQATSSVLIAPEAYQQLSAEQQQVVQRRLQEAPAPATRPDDPASTMRPDEPAPALKPFGYDMFAEGPTSIAPIEDLPVPADYTVGPGDEVLISAISPVRSGDYTLTVGRDGCILYPNIGSLAVAGMTYSRMVSFLTQTIKGEAANMQLTVRMGKLHSIRVTVVGHAKKPGLYTISSLSSLSNALMAFGGAASGGSLRDVQVRRSGRVVTHFDLYDFLMRGDSSKDVRLQSADVIVIPSAGPMVGVSGNVRVPAIYELKGKANLDEVLKLAGSISPNGYRQRLQIERFDENRTKQVLDVDLTDPKVAGTMPLRDGDLIKVFAVSAKLSNAVYLSGNVERPGQYQYRPNLRIRDILKSERDLKPESYLDFALIERMTGPDSHTELIPFNLGKAMAGDPKENRQLQPDDRVQVYYRWALQQKPMVRIAGAVNNAGEFQLMPNMTVAQLIQLAGGLKEQADYSNAELTRRQIVDNRVITQRMSLDLRRVLQDDRASNQVLMKDDYLLIKPLPGYSRVRTITLMGEVAQPGTYTARDGETLYDVIQRAGGFTSQAYLKGAIFTRSSVKRQQEERLQVFVQRLEENLYRKSAQGAAGALSSEASQANEAVLTSKKALLESLKQTKASGRMIVTLDDLVNRPHSSSDVQLEEGDVLMVPPVLNAVSILGQVYNPTAITYTQGKTVNDYLAKTGGPTDAADTGDIYVIKADGSVVTDQTYARGWWLWRRGIRSAVLEPGDTIVVPERLAEDTTIRDVRDITQIIFQIATTAALTWGIIR